MRWSSSSCTNPIYAPPPIQRIILGIESDASRVALQEYIFIESGLLLRLIGEIRKYYPKSLDEGDKDQEGEANGTIDTEAGKGNPSLILLRWATSKYCAGYQPHAC